MSSDSISTPTLWDHVSGDSIRYLYKHLVAGVRRAKTAVTFPFRCDAPGLRRFMAMELSHLSENEVQFRCRLVREESRAEIGLPATGPSLDGEIITMCSWCNRIATPEWVEVEAALSRLRLLERERPFQISHGTCNDCLKVILAQIEAS